MPATIRVENVSRIYRVGQQERQALKAVSLSVGAGQIVVLRGRSGSGKTTLLNCIGGLDRPNGGYIWVADQEITQLSEQRLVQLRRQQIGFVFQSHALLPTYSARENVDLMLRLTNAPRSKRQERVEQVLQLVGLGKWMDHRPHELSGGQQQRVAIARALAPRPAVILADEPTGELDSATGQQILALFRQIADVEKATILIATHDLAADAFADAVFHLADGRLAIRNA
ncbi:MAG: ABC transporter ATP-binding protein [Candidatus Promineifilaceae bacterium]|nr:ABC transporter ATP-binding protein [Anaerolineaceae bacterium]